LAVCQLFRNHSRKAAAGGRSPSVRRILRVALVLLVLALTLNCVAQPHADENAVVKPKRPRVGLALDSGGALGLAHVGVILWMEEHHIPVDYIAGTSMGGLVGGAYATGMSATEVKTMVSRIDWDNTVFSSRAKYEDLPLRLKNDQKEFPAMVEFGVNHGLRMPNGLNSGQNVDRLIASFAIPYSDVHNFDDLPIPFRCIATDLNSGQLHVFNSGVFSDALRATMSIPAVFEPVRIDGQLFVDGTLLDPLPTDVAREMGSDVVIAVFLESYVPGRTPGSPFGALFRSLEAVTLNAERKNMNGADLLLTVPLTDLDNLQYQRWELIIARGYAEAEKNSAALLKYALSEPEWNEYLLVREVRRKKVSGIQYVRMNGDARESKVRRSLDAEGLDREVAEVAAEGKYARIRPRLTTGPDGSLAVDLQATKKEYGPTVIEPILILDGSDYNNVRFSAGGRFFIPDVGLTGSEIRTDVLLGSTFRFASEYYLPIAGSKHWFTSIHAGTENTPMDFYTSHGKTAEYRRIFTDSGFDLVYAFNRFSELRVGYQLGWSKYSNQMGPAMISSSLDGRESRANLRFLLDKTDDPLVPTRGFAVESLFAYYNRKPGSCNSIPSLQLKLQGYQPVNEKGSLYLVATGGSTFGFTDVGFPLYSLGSTTTLAAYGSNEILTNQYWLVQTGYSHKLFGMPPLSGKNVYLVSGFEFAKPFYTTGISRLPMDFKTGILAQTLLGPIQIGASVGDTGLRKFYFQFGRVF
jgi:NTE family protein